jgi:diguanylate cyclase (GGDEF)-like protein/PAS domain S-box-containing protein
MQVPDKIRILMAEDVRTEAELELRELKRAGLRVDHRVVDTEGDFLRELRDFRPDIILSDFSMPMFDGMSALALAREIAPDTPFIFVSGTIGEEYAIRALKNGASDYVLKTNLMRLPPAVERAMSDKEARIQQRKNEEEQRRFRVALDASGDIIALVDRGSMRFVDVNNTMCELLGYSRDELLGMGPQDVLPLSLTELERAYDDLLANAGSSEAASANSHYRCKDGSLLPFESTRRVVRSEGADMIVAIARDIRSRIAAEDALRKSNERFKDAEDRLSYLAQFDTLTGLPNRHLFRDRLDQTLNQGKRSGRRAAVMFVDLDRFKQVNDALGHACGDMLLKEAAARISAAVRVGDTVGRFGSDEFGVVLPDLHDSGDADRVAQKIMEAIAAPFVPDGQETFITASIGIALYPADSEDSESLIANAGAAMQRAKEEGRGNCQYFTREMNERLHKRVQTETALRHALERREFLLHYQPKVDLATGGICGFEALLRWQHPERGLVSPLEFIPVLEDTGLIVPVGEWVVAEACRQLGEWKAAGIETRPVAVNLSARQFQEEGLLGAIRRILGEAGVDPGSIQFEITESLIMKDPERAVDSLRALRDAGFKLSVDDFGTGYSSLAYLKRFPLDALKIDRAFVREVDRDADDAAIALAIIGMAHSLKLKVVAEGVETESQLRFLRERGCDEIQGYYFSRPLAAGAATEALREGRRLPG